MIIDQMIVDQMIIDQMIVDQMIVDQIIVDQMSFGQIVFDEKTWSRWEVMNRERNYFPFEKIANKDLSANKFYICICIYIYIGRKALIFLRQISPENS